MVHSLFLDEPDLIASGWLGIDNTVPSPTVAKMTHSQRTGDEEMGGTREREYVCVREILGGSDHVPIAFAGPNL